MAGLALWKAPLGGLIAAALLLGAQPVLANDPVSLERDAMSEFNAGVDAENDGQNQTACRRYRNAAGLFNNAIYALLSYPMGTEDERDNVKGAANQLQSRVDLAKERANGVCGLSDGPSRGASSAAVSDDGADTASLEELQQAQTLARRQYDEASRKYEAHDFAGACASARLSADGFARIIAAMKADGSLEAAFGNPAQVYANAAQAIEDRDTFFCKS